LKNKNINTFLLVIVNILILGAIFFKFVDYRYEDAIYRSLVTANWVKNDQEQTFKNLLNLTHTIQTDRREYINELYGMNPFKSRWMRSGDIQLLDANGSCGNFSHVLAELCLHADMDVRIVQLKHQGLFGGHNIVEVLVNNKWVAADGLWKMYFINSDSTLASLEDIRANLDFFAKQIPTDYPYMNAYLEYHYTNWDKIPFLMPAIYNGLKLILGEKRTNEISLRVYFLNLHKAHFYFLWILYPPILIFTLYVFYQVLLKDNR
jgi:hypothetical protein